MLLISFVDIECKDSILKFDVKNKFMTDAEKDATHGIGLKNVKRRLELLYENQYDLKILDEAPWFIVNLTLIGK